MVTSTVCSFCHWSQHRQTTYNRLIKFNMYHCLLKICLNRRILLKYKVSNWSFRKPTNTWYYILLSFGFCLFTGIVGYSTWVLYVAVIFQFIDGCTLEINSFDTFGALLVYTHWNSFLVLLLFKELNEKLQKIVIDIPGISCTFLKLPMNYKTEHA